MSGLVRISGSAWAGAIRRAGGTFGRPLSVDGTSPVRSILAPASSSGLATRVVAPKNALDAAAVSQTEGSLRDAAAFTGFSNLSPTEHAISVRSLAASAEARSQGFASDDDVRVGTLTLSVHGTSYNISLSGGTINDVVAAIRNSGAAVDAATRSDGGKEFLTLKVREAGHAESGFADDALTISESYTGSTGNALQAEITQQASNAEIIVDGQSFIRRTNTVSDALPGATLRLESLQASTRAAFVNQPFKAGLAATTPSDVYSIAVNRLATAAQSQSQAFSSPLANVKAGVLEIKLEGTSYKVAIQEGSVLADVVTRIQASGAPVDVVVKTDAFGVSRLSLTSQQTGYTVGGRAEDALSISEESMGQTGRALAAAITQVASNAQVTINGTKIESSSNVLTDHIPGLRLDLRNVTETTQSLVGNRAVVQRAQENLVDSSNEIFRVLQDQLLTVPPQPVPLPGDTGARPDEIKATKETFNATDRKTGDKATPVEDASDDASATAAAAAAAPSTTAPKAHATYQNLQPVKPFDTTGAHWPGIDAAAKAGVPEEDVDRASPFLSAPAGLRRSSGFAARLRKTYLDHSFPSL